MTLHHSARPCIVPVAITAVALLWLSACSSGSTGNGNDPAPPIAPPAAGPTPPPIPPPPQGPLTGDAAGLAKTAIQTVDVGDTYTPAEISVGPAGEEIIRTKLQIVFRPEARVGQVNTLLTDLKAVITTSIANFETVVVRIPDPGSLGALDTIVAQIETEPFVWFVGRSMLPTAEALPGNIEPEPGTGVAVRHHLAVGAAGAWNARGAMVDSTRVVIWDYFGDGVPNDDLDHAYDGDPAVDFATGALINHGYHVAGIIAGLFGGPDAPRGYVTGMMPGKIQLSVIDGQKTDPLDGSLRLLMRLQALGGGTALVNISQGVSASCNTPVTCRPDAEWRPWGAWWVQAIRTLGLENRVLILKSAGNINDNGNDDARYNRFEAIAALSPDLVDASGTPLPPLTNTLVVENIRPMPDFPYEGPRCLSSLSWRGGNVGAIGSGVWSLTDAGSTADYRSGTSMATPQVAGLAAYLLAIRPELTPQEIKAILLETAATVPAAVDPGCSAWLSPAPIIQAYPALLALDRPSEGNEQVPVRRAILDINDSRTFTGDDIVAILLAFETALGAVDFGRADLNNDGRTGGETTRPFDLDLDRVRAASGVTATILGKTFAFDETALTDVAILCYYAYSSLYTGSAEARDLLLEPYRELGQCGEVSEYSVSATLQGRMFAGVAVPLWVTVSDRDGAVEGASISVTAEGGSAGGGVTDVAGRMESSANIDPDAEFLTLTIKASVDGEVVGERVLRAGRALPAIAGGAARVPCCSLSNISSGASLSPPGGTASHAVVPSRTITWTWDPGVSPEEPTYRSKMQSFTATGHDVQLQVSFGTLSTSDDDPTYLSLVVETTGPAPRNAYTLFDCPSGTPWETGWPSGACVYVAGNIERFILGELVPPPGNPGTLELLRDRSYTLVLYSGSVAGDSFNVDLLFSRDAAEGP